MDAGLELSSTFSNRGRVQQDDFCAKRYSVIGTASTPRLVAFVLALPLVACGPEGPEGPDFERSDSAGIRIALSREPQWLEDIGGALSETPILEIGREEGEDAYLLSGVSGAARLSDGSVVVCNAADRTLRYFGPDGVYTHSGGGQGAGPGELRRMTRCLQRNGRTWVYQAPALPIEVFDEAGVRVASATIPKPGDRVARLLDIGEDGSLVLGQDAPRRDLDAGVSILPTTVFRSTADGELVTLGTFDGAAWVRGDRVTFPAAFSPTLQAAAVGDLTVVSWPESFDLALIGREGATSVRLRRVVLPTSVSAAHRSAFELRVLEGPMPAGDTPYEDEQIRRAIVDMMVYPAVFPAHYRVITSTDHYLWVERGDGPRDPLPQVADPNPSPTTWDVFSPEGRWLGPGEMPARYDPSEIGGAYVLGVHRDELGVERVRMYHLTKPRLDR